MTEPTPAAPAGARTNTLAIIALIAAFVFSPVGIILGIIAQGQIKQTGEAGAGLAKAGIILGIVFTILWILVFVLSALLPLLLLGSVGGYTY